MPDFIHIPVLINDNPCQAVIDTGANIHIMNDVLAHHLSLVPQPPAISIRQLEGSAKSIGRVTVKLQISHVIKEVTIHIIKDFLHPLLLGIKLGDQYDIHLNLKQRSASLRTSPKALPASSSSSSVDPMTPHKGGHSGMPHIPPIGGVTPYAPSLEGPHHPTSSTTSSVIIPTDMIHCPLPATASFEECSSSGAPRKEQALATMGNSQSISTTLFQPVSLEDLLNEFDHLFSQSDDDYGCINLVQHRIRIKPDQPPIAVRPYRASPAVQDEIRRQVNMLLKNGIIRPSESPWAAAVTMVKKSDEGNEKRMCPDYRPINDITIDDKFPLPNINDTIDRLRGAKYFTKLDIRWGYWHVMMHPDDIEKTAFVTADGHFEWLRMPFGLKNAPATFQRIIQVILGDLRFTICFNYLDDIVIFSSDLKTHLRDVRRVLCRLFAHHIKLKRSKCEFAKTEVEFLGYLISNNQVRPGKKIAAVKDYPAPKCLKELQRFLGLANWFRSFIPNFTEISHPLYQLLKSSVLFHFEEAQKEAFNKLKEALTSSPVLMIFDPEKTCELFVDASRVGIGGILCQRDDEGALHPIAYFSKRISPQQEHWHTTDLESLALVKSVLHFDHYLQGKTFIVYTDHSALPWLLNSTNLTGKAYRWFLLMSTYSMQVIHRRGSTMAHVDALSRAPITDTETSIFVVDFSQTEEFHCLSLHWEAITLDELRKAQIDADLSFIGKPIIVDRIHYIEKKGSKRAVVPINLRPRIMNYYHQEYGHPGIQKTAKLVSHYYWWPNMLDDVTAFVSSCSHCQLAKSPNTPSYGQLQPMPCPDQPLELASMDAMVMGSVASNTSAKNIQVLIDHHSRFVWAAATPKNTLDTVKTFLIQVFRATPWPKYLLTDRAPNFATNQFKSFLASKGTHHLLTTSYHPQTNGMVEKVNRTIKERLIIACQLNPKRKWSSLLNDVVTQYNNTPHDITGFAPFYLMYGILPSDSPIPPPSMEPLEDARKIAKARTLRHQQLRKKRYDDKHLVSPFQIGDLVRRQIASNHPSLNKLSLKFDGPFVIVSQPTTNTFNIQRYHSSDETIQHVNVSQLRPWSEPNFDLSQAKILQPDPKAIRQPEAENQPPIPMMTRSRARTMDTASLRKGEESETPRVSISPLSPDVPS